MKIRVSHRERGIVLVATLATVLILAIILTSYLNLVNNQNTSVARSQTWNESIPVLESGIEEALSQLHFAGTNSLMLTSNSWTYGADGLYHKSRSLPDGSYCNVSIKVATNPVITSTGFVAWAYVSSSTNTKYLTRRVKVVAQKIAATPGGLNAKGTITFGGSGTYLDSFDSSNPSYSSNQQYSANLKESNGGATTDSNAIGAINTGSGRIYGSATTGPTGTVVGIVTGSTSHNANLQFNDVSAPADFTSAAPPQPGAIGSTNFAYLLGKGDWSLSSLSLSSGSALGVNGDATLYINGAASISGQSYIYIAPGASLTLYLNGPATLAGNGIVNGTQTASQCTVYGMTNCTTMSYAGSSDFTGTIYAPDAALSISGGSDAYGSFTANTITIAGNTGIHYDEALAHAGQKYVAISWNEF
jgi:hypothetical protein